MTLAVMLVDDHPVVRAGVRAVLEAHPDLTVVAEAGDGAEALRVLEGLAAGAGGGGGADADVGGAGVDSGAGLDGGAGGLPDVVLMDLQMGEGMDGVAATRAVRAAHPGLPVLILTTFDTEADILAALDAGASGYLLKDASSEEIAAAVRRAAAGQRALAPGVAERLMGRMAGGTEVLTAREIELLELIAQGVSNKAAAKELFISEATVKTHLVHVFQKLGVGSRTEAVAEARRRRIIRG
ncbi:response regulator transcription factor [Micrococcus lylae]|uniref:Response regulator transcription factor n=1 Tax=Micrococcus lylae TaxID=1273 RepID=A0ABY2JZ01_9MICC|nr:MULTISPECIES: response regulator transcription factor [Micrococcus]MCT2007897.1 response regulator transcription factor [Micrococcus lylae]MCT2071628.1 response regulator transcription factor [Micrococcus lylae]OFR88627.1 DNA-binding response regulator [Micrococcus sp. HMSC067E09]TFH98981.1 response regulator transcription factor [Micrococcus lylae]WIK81336.1 response regulator transcription factor [Micrococcus lylae]